MQFGPCEPSPAGTEARSAEARISPWPGGAPFALFLSHDIDQIYDRELFRLLGDVNHLRRVWMNGEPGTTLSCLNRIARNMFRPREPGQDVEAILSIERAYKFRSTFFLLEDRVFSRKGGRYRYSDPATQRIARLVLNNGCEIAVHGAYHNHNEPAVYCTQARSFRDAFGQEPKGVRNHCLRHDGFPTWQAQRAAGFRYDASFGFNERVGIRKGLAQPFFPFDGNEGDQCDFVVLPMNIMDNVLFWGMRLSAAEALLLCKGVAEKVKMAGGLLCLNWHNNYFHEEEYKDWQDVYESLVGWLADQRPWNATGEEIANWWMRHTDPAVPGRGEANTEVPQTAL